MIPLKKYVRGINIHNIDLSGVPTENYSGTLYRVSSKRNLGKIRDIHSLREGESMRLDAPLSTSSSEKYVDEQIIRKGRVNKTHEVKDVFSVNGEAINVNSMVPEFKHQDEFILPKGTELKLLKTVKGVNYYDIKE